MKTLTFTLLLNFFWSISFAQTTQNRKVLDSLKHQLTLIKHDTSRVLILADLCSKYRNPNPDSALLYGQKALKLVQQINFPKGEILALSEMGRVMLDMGKLPQSLDMQFKALQVAENNHLSVERIIPLNYIGNIYFTLGSYSKALSSYGQAMAIAEANHKSGRVQKMNMGNAFEKMNQLDSALYYEQQAYKEMLLEGNSINPIIFRNLGNIQAKLGNNRLALDYY